MGDEDRDRFADQLLELALARYRSEQPRAGLEGRLLASLRARQRASRERYRWLWAAAATAAVAIALAGAYRARRPAGAVSEPRAPAIEPSRTALPATGQPTGRRTSPREGRRRWSTLRARLAPPEPRRDQFPTPTPLTAEERLLLSYAKLAQSPSSMSFHDDGHALAALEIKPLEIKPLEGDSAAEKVQ